MWKLLFALTCMFVAACDDDRPPPLANSTSTSATGFASTLRFGERDGVARMAWINAPYRSFSERKGKLVDAGRFRRLTVGAPQHVDWSVFEGAKIDSLHLVPINCNVTSYGIIRDADTCRRAEQSFLPPEAFKFLPTIDGLKGVYLYLNRQKLDEDFYRRLSEFIVLNPSVSLSFRFLPGEFDLCKLNIPGAGQPISFLNTSLDLPDDAYRMIYEPGRRRKTGQVGDVFYDPRQGNITRNEVVKMENYIFQRPHIAFHSSYSTGRRLNLILSRGTGNDALWNHNCEGEK